MQEKEKIEKIKEIVSDFKKNIFSIEEDTISKMKIVQKKSDEKKIQSILDEINSNN